jgi:hypothetical protein
MHGFAKSITDVVVYLTAAVTLLALFDWFLTNRQKARIAEIAAALWVWLDDQRAGQFFNVVRSPRAQRVFSLLAHAIFLSATIGVAIALNPGRFQGVYIFSGLEPIQVYSFQPWLEVLAVVLSAVILSARVHPRVTAWMGSATGISRYFARCIAAALVLIGLRFIVMLPVILIVRVRGITEALETLLYLRPLLARTLLVVLHACLVFVWAPVWVENVLVEVILWMLVFWFVIVCVSVLLFRIGQFFLLRIVERREGPVLGLSALLLAIASLARFLLGTTR